MNDEWVKLAEGTTIGYKRLLRFPDASPSQLRITISETRETANIQRVGAYYAPSLEDSSKIVITTDIPKDAWKTTKENPLIIDLGETISLKGLTYSPTDNKESVFTYILSVSENGTEWTEVKKGEFSNIKNNPIMQEITLNEAVNARFIQLETVRGVDGGKPSVEINQIGVRTK